MKNMESVAEVVVVGAGVAGLATALGLHRYGMRSLILESADCLRVMGFAFMTWANAWRALDALGIGDVLRSKHGQIQKLISTSTVTGMVTSEVSFLGLGKCGTHETRCVSRKSLLEALAGELPLDSIRFGCKVVCLEQAGNLQRVHLVDGSVIVAKIVIGCDGVNSIVAKSLGFEKPAYATRSAVRGIAEFPEGHGFKTEVLQYFGEGFRSGFIPCSENNIYWFFTYSPSPDSRECEESAAKMKKYVLRKLGNIPGDVREVVERSKFESVISSPLGLRWPWQLLWGNICRGNVCVAGDAFHPMTPDIGQGGCLALEDGVILARCIAEALSPRERGTEEEEYGRIKRGLQKYASERRWRSVELITCAYVVGLIQESKGKLMNFLRDRILPAVMTRLLLKAADFDCGELYKP